MRAMPRYPVDRYLVENSTKIEMVNINDDDLWNSEPAMRPEDEIMLRQLHNMLQTTADDLKVLTGQLAQNRPAPVNNFRQKTQPVPFDEEFNEKIHIEELVNAKFFGHNIIDQPTLRKPVSESPKKCIPKPYVNTGVQVDTLLNTKKPVVNKNLEITKTRIMEIQEKKNRSTKEAVDTVKAATNAPAVAYNEFIYENVEPTMAISGRNKLKKQDLPSINIRSELKEQKVLQLDIFPDDNDNEENVTSKVNVGVITVEHEKITPKEDPKIVISNREHTSNYIKKRIPIRKSTKMLTCESSGSTNNNSSDTQLYPKSHKQIKSIIKSSTKSQTQGKSTKNNLSTKETDIRPYTNVEEWKKKLNSIYGQPSTSRKFSKVNNTSSKKSNLTERLDRPKSGLNNAEYIPYSKLTLGGVKVSDIEREISDVRKKNDMPLSHLVDKILSSRENSFHTDTPKKSKRKENKESPRIFTTSDENLLHEVIDIEKTVSETIGKSVKKEDENIENKTPISSIESKEEEEEDKNSYADDFEEDKSDDSLNESKKESDGSEYQNKKATSNNDSNSDIENTKVKPIINTNIHNRTFTKAQTLAIKESVEVFEFVHSVDTQDSATQSQAVQKICLKETQTSPRNDRPTIQPIHNDLWPLDPNGEVEKMFKLEKDFIKKLIVEEYGELLEKNVAKPSTSTESAAEKQKNVSALQKNIQTSPARVKSVMTSPTKTKTRTTSPFLSLTVDHQTSPMIVVTNEEQLTVQVEDDEDGISINLSSPRFNLRLPQSSREVLSNLECASATPISAKTTGEPKDPKKKHEFPIRSKTYRKNIVSSSSSELENSSEMSSLGEVKLKLKRRIKKRISSISESSETSSMSKYSYRVPYGDVIPLNSEGEASFRQAIRKSSNKTSEGETSLRKLPK